MLTTTEQVKPPSAASPLALRGALAVAFFDEVLEAADTLGAIAEDYGQRTLLDLFYLQAALLSGDWIDAWAGESRVVEFLRLLPSAGTWLANVRQLDHGDVQEDSAPALASATRRPADSPVVALAEGDR